MFSVTPQTKDCNVVASKLTLLLDDLLWVLTDSQLKAMMKYAESLSEAMEKSAQQRKSLAPEPVQVRGTLGICLGWGGRWLARICAGVGGMEAFFGLLIGFTTCGVAWACLTHLVCSLCSPVCQMEG